MSNTPEPGDVYQIDHPLKIGGGMLKPKEAQRLLVAYLGAVPAGGDPEIDNRLFALGWERANLYTITVMIHEDGEDEPKLVRMLYRADTLNDTILSGIRFAQAQTSGSRTALIDVEINRTRVGTIDTAGLPDYAMEDPVFTWHHNLHGSLLERAEELLDAVPRSDQGTEA